MQFSNRLLVGVNGAVPDPQLIRYAAMVARLNAPMQRVGRDAFQPCYASVNSSSGECLKSQSGFEDAEVRFVQLLPDKKTANVPGGQWNAASELDSLELRTSLRENVETYFTKRPEQVVGCDMLKGRAVKRLPALVEDFDGDLLLLGDGGWSRRKLGRLAMASPCNLWLVPPGWAPMVRHVLVPIDFSDRSATSLQTAVELAGRFAPAKCLALYVDRSESRFFDDVRDQTRRRVLSASFEQWSAAIDTRGVRIEPLFVRARRIDRAIADAAERYRADVIVMATRGRTRLAGAVLPSVTEAAIRGCGGSFLILKSASRPLGLAKAWRERLERADEPQFS